MSAEQVVLLDEQGRAIGTEDKATVHHDQTPLHLAFSCYLFDEAGSVLITRRARDKRTFPGVVTNSCCGHPGAGEPMEAAVRRRVQDELGLELSGLRLILPEFRYRAEMDGVVENEMCPVYIATAVGSPKPDPAEVDEAQWVEWHEFRADVLAGRLEVSSWCQEQLIALPEDPVSAPSRAATELPPAAR